MTVKLSGADFLAFWKDESWFPKDGAVEDEAIYVNRAEDPLDPHNTDYSTAIKPTDTVRVVGGYVEGFPNHKTKNLERILREWLRENTTTAFVVRVSKDKEVEFRDWIRGQRGIMIE